MYLLVKYKYSILYQDFMNDTDIILNFDEKE